jgi:hypothetical protein
MNDITQFELVLREALFGFSVMAIVAACNIYSFAWINISYSKILSGPKVYGEQLEVMRFVTFTMLLAVSLLFSLSVWVIALTWFGFVPHWLDALLLATSFFTTVGNITTAFPYGWRLLPSIIAFSGLFSFGWATATSMQLANSMGQQLRRRRSISR